LSAPQKVLVFGSADVAPKGYSCQSEAEGYWVEERRLATRCSSGATEIEVEKLGRREKDHKMTVTTRAAVEGPELDFVDGVADL
jgi:hypothetical protein